MDSIEDLNCPVCLELSKNAVQSDCCGHAFCQSCADLIKNKQNQCPFCKAAPFNFREGKLIRRMISGIKVQCPNEKCEQKVANSDLQMHIDYCAFSVANCRVCNERLINKQLVKHTLEKHQAEIQRAVIDYHKAPKSKISTVSTQDSKLSTDSKNNNITLSDPSAKIKNKNGRVAAIGTSGKYYCGGPLLYKCSCCDGNCGLTNGENCAACMQLDLKMRGFPKGFLVNSNGVMSKVDLKKKTAYCGILLSSFGDSKCVAGNSCRFCNNLSKTLPRYQSLCGE